MSLSDLIPFVGLLQGVSKRKEQKKMYISTKFLQKLKQHHFVCQPTGAFGYTLNFVIKNSVMTNYSGIPSKKVPEVTRSHSHEVTRGHTRSQR